MNAPWGRWAVLTGVPFAVLLFIGALIGGNSPNSDATAQHVVTWYQAHRGGQMASAFLVVYGLILGLFFAAALRSYLRSRSDSDGLATLGFAGAIVLAIGGFTLAGLSYAAADVPTKITPSAEQSLNVLANDTFFALLAGAGIFLIGNGLAILSAATLPRWLGWVAIPLAVVAVTPLGWFVLIFALPIWSLIVSVLMFLRQGERSSTAAPAAAAG